MIYYILLLLSILIINYEKHFFSKILSNKITQRPNCTNNIECLGMPSGHTQFITIIAISLYLNNIIPLHVAVLLIIAVGLQRILSKAHTILQVIIGFIIGFVISTGLYYVFMK